MTGIIDINKGRIPKGKALLKVVNNLPKNIILPNESDKAEYFSHYEVMMLNDVDTIDVKVGDYVIAANGISQHGGFEIDDELYIIISGYNIDMVTIPDNFKRK